MRRVKTGSEAVKSSNDEVLAMHWVDGEHAAELHVDLATLAYTLRFSDNIGGWLDLPLD